MQKSNGPISASPAGLRLLPPGYLMLLYRHTRTHTTTSHSLENATSEANTGKAGSQSGLQRTQTSSFPQITLFQALFRALPVQRGTFPSGTRSCPPICFSLHCDWPWIFSGRQLPAGVRLLESSQPFYCWNPGPSSSSQQEPALPELKLTLFLLLRASLTFLSE